MEQDKLLLHVMEILENQQITYMLVGSFASSVYGEPRLTQDIDIVVDLQPNQIERLCAAFPPSEFYVSLAAARRAVQNRGQFNVIHPSSGNKIDFLIARNDSWGREQLSRRQRKQIFPDRECYTARPEDIILGKLHYYHEGGSEKHLRDITAMIQISRAEINFEYVMKWADEIGVKEIWEDLLKRIEDG